MAITLHSVVMPLGKQVPGLPSPCQWHGNITGSWKLVPKIQHQYFVFIVEALINTQISPPIYANLITKIGYKSNVVASTIPNNGWPVVSNFLMTTSPLRISVCRNNHVSHHAYEPLCRRGLIACSKPASFSPHIFHPHSTTVSTASPHS